jgi:hypothetical protein
VLSPSPRLLFVCSVVATAGTFWSYWKCPKDVIGHRGDRPIYQYRYYSVICYATLATAFLVNWVVFSNRLSAVAYIAFLENNQETIKPATAFLFVPSLTVIAMPRRYSLLRFVRHNRILVSTVGALAGLILSYSVIAWIRA